MDSPTDDPSSGIDVASFPHIVDNVLEQLLFVSPLEALHARLVCKSWSKRVSKVLFRHLWIGPDLPDALDVYGRNRKDHLFVRTCPGERACGLRLPPQPTPPSLDLCPDLLDKIQIHSTLHPAVVAALGCARVLDVDPDTPETIVVLLALATPRVSVVRLPSSLSAPFASSGPMPPSIDLKRQFSAWNALSTLRPLTLYDSAISPHHRQLAYTCISARSKVGTYVLSFPQPQMQRFSREEKSELYRTLGRIIRMLVEQPSREAKVLLVAPEDNSLVDIAMLNSEEVDPYGTFDSLMCTLQQILSPSAYSRLESITPYEYRANFGSDPCLLHCLHSAKNAVETFR